MYTQNNTYSITDLRQKTSKVLKDAEEKGVIYVLYRSKVKAALVDAAYLEALQQSHEDYLDMLEFDQTIKLPRIPLAEHKKRHAKNE